jgi:hypothetical protein
MQELSPLRGESAKQIAPTWRSVVHRKQVARPWFVMVREPTEGQELPLVLGFDAGHFQLSEGPILEEMIYA